MKSGVLGLVVVAACAHGVAAAPSAASTVPQRYDAIIAKHAAATGVPETLIRRIIVRESKYNPTAMNRGHFGMMQIKPATAKSMGYQGGAAGLLDADTNLTYGVRYLAGAYKVAGGDHDRAVRLYASGYYYDAKRKGLLAAVGLGRNAKPFAPVAPSPTIAPAQTVVASVAPVVASPAVASPAVKIETRLAATAPVPVPPLPPVAARAGSPAAPRVISPNAAPALASTLPALPAAVRPAPGATLAAAVPVPAPKPSAAAVSTANGRVAGAVAAFGGLERTAAAERAPADPRAAAFAGARPTVASPLANVAAPRPAAVPTPPRPPVARAPQQLAATAPAPATVGVARPLPPTAPTVAAIPLPPSRDPVVATASITPPAPAPRIPSPRAGNASPRAW